ncbi:MAG TPA: SCO family protein [Candidatus Acidoferrum sp.]|jgi:protein SCO1/2|nr:SCO family protein [Candidatus Acidoferrum sp.]
MFRSAPWLVILGTLVVSCQRSGDTGSPPQPARNQSTNQQIFQVKGVVQAVKPRQKEVEIKHEAVPGYMPAMTMPFDVKDTNELAGLEPGERVAFRLIVTDTEGWIDQIRKLAPPTNTPPTTGAFRLVRDVEPLEVGDRLPEYHFTNEFGQAFSTARFRGQALALTFLFTRCPYPNFCPRMANNFEEAQEKLLALANGPTNWQFLTISFDPEFDKPAVLKAYADFHRYDPHHWTFATGELIDITGIAEQFGLAFWHDETGSISHNLRTAVLDASGRVQKVFEGNNWTSNELVAEMVKAAEK